MAKRDYYDVLGITKSSSRDEIKKAYRKLALKYHPDKTKGDKKSEEKFKEASEAYHVLSDEKRKSNYDQFGHAAFEGGGGGFQGFEGKVSKAGYTKVTVLTIPVQYTAGRNNRKGGAVRSFLRATSRFLPDTSLSGDSENGIPR